MSLSDLMGLAEGVVEDGNDLTLWKKFHRELSIYHSRMYLVRKLFTA